MVSDGVHINYNADITVVLKKLVYTVLCQLLQLSFCALCTSSYKGFLYGILSVNLLNQAIAP